MEGLVSSLHDEKWHKEVAALPNRDIRTLSCDKQEVKSKSVTSHQDHHINLGRMSVSKDVTQTLKESFQKVLKGNV